MAPVSTRSRPRKTALRNSRNSGAQGHGPRHDGDGDRDGGGDGDGHVGARIRLARKLRAITQAKLAESVGVSFQQIQKYEKGANRVTAARLRDIAKALNLPVDWFFEEDGSEDGPASAGIDQHAIEVLASREGIVLVTTFARIRSPALRRRVVALVQSVADLGELEGDHY